RIVQLVEPTFYGREAAAAALRHGRHCKHPVWAPFGRQPMARRAGEVHIKGEPAAIALPHPAAMLEVLLRKRPREDPMCRWIAYRGETIPLEQYVTAPAHSLVVQSQRALESTAATNGDGFGMGWYGTRPEPGLHRQG